MKNITWLAKMFNIIFLIFVLVIFNYLQQAAGIVELVILIKIDKQ